MTRTPTVWKIRSGLIGRGFTYLVNIFNGDYANAYAFHRVVGYFDHRPTTDYLTAQVSDVTVRHINTDEPAVIDYIQDFNPTGYWSQDSDRALDHDPGMVGLEVNGPSIWEDAAPSLESLWPVNLKFISVSILDVTDPDSDPISDNVDSILQDEPVNGNGDSNAAPDGAGMGTDIAELQSERAGGGNGRSYHVFFTADDGNNQSYFGDAIVFVPKNQSMFGTRIDGGPLYDSTLPQLRFQ